MTEVLAPETEAREQIIKVLKEVYEPEGFPVRSDKLHKSLGDSGTTLGVYTKSWGHGKIAIEAQMIIVVQFYGKYVKEVNRAQTVDPAKIEAYAERLRQKFKLNSTTEGGLNTPTNWYFMLERIEYPEDPTGNQTRYEAQILARGNNTALR